MKYEVRHLDHKRWRSGTTIGTDLQLARVNGDMRPLADVWIRWEHENDHHSDHLRLELTYSEAAELRDQLTAALNNRNN